MTEIIDKGEDGLKDALNLRVWRCDAFDSYSLIQRVEMGGY